MKNETVEALGFFQQTMQPSIFWTAVSAVGTMLAVAVALMYPIYSNKKRVQHIEELLLSEVKNNLDYICRITPDGKS